MCVCVRVYLAVLLLFRPVVVFVSLPCGMPFFVFVSAPVQVFIHTSVNHSHPAAVVVVDEAAVSQWFAKEGCVGSGVVLLA